VPIQPAVAHLGALLGEEVVRYDHDLRLFANGGQQFGRPFHLDARGDVGIAIRVRRLGRTGVVGLDPGGPVQLPEALDPRDVERQPAANHLEMQTLENTGVRPFELVGIDRIETGVQRAHAAERGSRTLPMIEERVVEIEEYGAHHPTIIESRGDKLIRVPAVVIAASNLMAPLCKHLAGEGELITFADSEPIQALQAILDRRPGVIVLERLFAATPRGAALINRIKTDPNLSGCQVRVMSHTGDYTRQISRSVTAAPVGASMPEPAAAAVGLEDESAVDADAPRPIDWHGTRRAPRFRMREGVEIQLDGTAVTLVDLSAVGAQVISSTILRPNQKVRVIIPHDEAFVRGRGSIAWARFELPRPSSSPVYRAGVEFLEIDAAVVEAFKGRHSA
jgi:hypothetical protein